MGELAFGVDVGGTFTKLAAVSPRGRILRQEQIPTQPRSGPAAFVARIVDALRGWQRQGLAAGACGLGVAGDVEQERGRLRAAPNLPGWEGFPFRAVLRR